MIKIIYNITGLVLYSLFSMQIYAQGNMNQNIKIDSFIVKDLQDAANEVGLEIALIVADTIFIDYNIIFHGLSVVFICNHLENKDNSITLMPVSKEKKSYSKDGKGLNEKTMAIISKAEVKGIFNLPGGKGGKGKDGEKGLDGKRGDIKDCCTDINKGEVGRNGQNGANGGFGGILKVFTKIPSNETKIKLSASGGEGGVKGLGGQGGTSYSVEIENEPGRKQKVWVLLREKRGEDGKPGKKGKKGCIKLNRLSANMFSKKMINYGISSLNSTEVPFAMLIEPIKNKFEQRELPCNPPVIERP